MSATGNKEKGDAGSFAAVKRGTADLALYQDLLNKELNVRTKFEFGFGALSKLDSIVEELGGTNVLIVTDSVMVKTGAVAKVAAQLRNVKSDVFDQVQPEPRLEIYQLAADKVRSGKYDLVIAVGGGSPQDIGKVTAAMATNAGDVRSYIGNNKFTADSLPTILIDTTAGTGAYLTVTSMVTADGRKQWINSPLLIPKRAIVDPELTMTMPKSVTAATGIDALCHNTEAYFSALANGATDKAALYGIRHIVPNIEKAYDNGSDKEAREAMSVGALMGGIALQAKQVYGHTFGYVIIERKPLPHGVSVGVALPYILSNYSAITTFDRLKPLAEAYGINPYHENHQIFRGDPAHPMGSSRELPKTNVELGREMAEKVVEMLKHMNLPSTLNEAGIAEADLPAFAKEVLGPLYKRTNSPLQPDENGMLKLVANMFNGDLTPIEVR